MDYASLDYNPMVEKIVDVLVQKTQNASREFFRLQVNYYLGLMVSSMNMKLDSPITTKVPINVYGVNLAHSGSGKGFSTNFLENQVIHRFKDKFLHDVMPKKAELSMEMEAISRANILGCTDAEALEKIQKEYASYGAYKFTFDNATSPAIKQLRNKLLLAKCGALNLIVDEIGANLASIEEPLHTYLELYDKGLIKDKLTKNTDTNTRFHEMFGMTPANLLLFGTPSKLLDGSRNEKTFFELLEMGYARRCFFAYSKKNSKLTDLTAEQLYDMMANPASEKEIETISLHLAKLAEVALVGSTIEVPKDVGIKLLEYRRHCEIEASKLPEHEELLKAEMSHRYFKALKLAGVYAAIEGSFEVSETNLNQAIRFTEDSSIALKALMKREKPYEKLAKYIADTDGELTQADLVDALPFYRGSQTSRTEMINLACAWGYSNNILIKRQLKDGIEFFSGEGLVETDLTKLIVSYSKDWADGYLNDHANWTNKGIVKLLQQPEFNWCSHHTVGGHRSEADMIAGFNILVLDIDEGTPIDVAQQLLSEYEYILHTTKSHQIEKNGKICDRYRILLPMSHTLKLNAEDYKTFMANIQEWLPFPTDTATFQRSRKWATNHEANFYSNTGKLLDVLPFIPKTSKEQNYKAERKPLENLSNIERWFAVRMVQGNRNNELYKYGAMLLDSGMSLDNVERQIIDFNSRLSDPLSEQELAHTVFKSLANKGV